MLTFSIECFTAAAALHCKQSDDQLGSDQRWSYRESLALHNNVTEAFKRSRFIRFRKGK